ncbi:MAG: universal stress protein [Dehalococcoidia bacterium]
MRLLVAFDGSEGAHIALREAAALARETGASVVLVHALNPLLDAAEVVAPSTMAAMRVVSAQSLAAMDEAAAAAGLDVTRVTCEVAQLRHGEDDAEAIERVAAEQGATMIVISSRRAASVVGMVLGSVTQHVLRHAPCPVLVVRA